MAKQKKRRIYYVTSNWKAGWDVKRKGCRRASGHFSTKKEAVSFGKRLAKSGPQGQLIIHKKDGKIQAQYGYKGVHSSNRMSILERGKQIKKTLKYLAAFGNQNILNGHIKDLEKDILNLGENGRKDITNTPHFSAWIRLYCEYFSNSLFHSHYKMHLDEAVYNDNFKTIIKKIKKEHERNPDYLKKQRTILSDIIDDVYTIIELRHCFHHGGLPNLIKKLKHTRPERIDELLNPINFEKTRRIFKKALVFTLTLPKQSVRL